MITIKHLLNEAVQELASLASARIDSEALLCFVLDKDRAFLYAYPEQTPSVDQTNRFRMFIEERKQGKPVAYLVQQREFWSLPLLVNEATLIPRSETELLVELILHAYPAHAKRRVLDLGTGSGAIALALAKEHLEWEIIAADISHEALTVAKKNAKRLSFSNIHFTASNWFSHIDPSLDFDIIVSNPPYLAPHDPHLQQGDLRFEPLSALVAEHHGLAAFEQIIHAGLAKLKPGGLLLVEHGFDQREAVLSLFYAAGYEHIQSWQDGQGHYRACGGKRPSA